MGEYAKNHVASACYLRGFTDDAGQVEVSSVDPAVAVECRKPENVGYRRNFWGEDGALRREAERMLGEIESEARDALRCLRIDWTPSDELANRVTILRFLSIHLVRTPGWKRLLGELAERWVLEQGENYGAELSLEQRLEIARSDQWAYETLKSEIPVLASMFGAMHWTLVGFPEPCLATSDQPLVAVPFRPGGPGEILPFPAVGLLHVSEYRLAIDPEHLLLLTWLDRGDLDPPVSGSRRIAETVNVSVRAQADRQWFRRPGTETPLGAVVLGHSEPPAPIAPTLLPPYSPGLAMQSQCRHVAERQVHEMIGRGVTDELRGVVMRRRAA